MALLTDAQVILRTGKPSYAIWIDGKRMLPADPNDATGIPGIESWETEISFEGPINQARIVLNRLADWFDRGQTVTIEAGYGGVHERVFTGYIAARGEEDSKFARNLARTYGADTGSGAIVGVASLLGGGNLFKPAPPAGWYSEIEDQHPLVDTQAKADEMALRSLARHARIPRRPAGDINRRTLHCVSQLDKAERTIEMTARSFDLQTVTAAIGNVCDYVGITNRFIETAFAGFTLGTASLAQLERMPAIQMLAYLVKLIGSSSSATAEGKFFDSDDGITQFLVMDDMAPSGTAFRTLSTETQAQAYIIDNSSHLIIPCDPRIKLGMTLGLVQPRLSLNGRFVVVGRKISFSKAGFINDLDMRGGDELGGVLGINPVASFAYRVTREVVGDRVYAYVSFVDQSYDTDGTISTRAWTDTHATLPEISTFTGKSGQVRIDAATTGYAITLTVTDNDGLSRAVTQAIDLGSGVADNEQPALYVAQSVGAGVSPDGGQSWNDQADATCMSVDAKPSDGTQSGIGCFGMTNGRIKRTTDFARSALSEVLAVNAANGEIRDIWWDKNVNTRVWASTSTGRLLRSDDDGATWATSYFGGAAGIYKDFGNTYPINRIATPIATQVGEKPSVWALGGRGDVPATLIQFDHDLDGAFTSPTIAGELATALVGASSSITVAAAASRQAGELLVAFKGAAFPGAHVSLYYTNDIHGDGTAWKEATGLDAGLVEWRWVSPSQTPGIFYGQANNRDIWKINCTTGTPVCTKIANVLGAGETPNYGLWEGEFIGGVTDVYLIAVQVAAFTSVIRKWVAEEATAGLLRNATGFTAAPANAQGLMIAIGAPARGTSLAGRLAATTQSASPRTITKLLDSATWDALKTLTGVTDSNPRPFWLKPNVCMVTNGSGTPAYSKDGGATFAALAAALAGAVWFARGADGKIWALVQTGATTTEIYRSSDDGDTWNGPGTGSFALHQPVAIACHPTDANKIVAFGTGGGVAKTWTTINGGSTWTANSGGTRPTLGGSGMHSYTLEVFPNGRIVAAGQLLTGAPFKWRVMISDDWGANWTTKYSEDDSSITYHKGGIHSSGRMVIPRSDTDPTPDTFEPLVSVDFAQTVTALSPTQTLAAFTGDTTPGILGGAYDGEKQTLYVATAATGFEVVSLSPLDSTGVWTNLKDAIGSTTFGSGNLSVIPRT